MAKPKYKTKYCDEVVEYFSRFLEMRDDPDAQSASEELRVKSEEGTPHQSQNAQRSMGASRLACGVGQLLPGEKPWGKPCSGYPSLIKFARKIGVTPRTLTNWRQKYPQFDEACEFADLIQDEVLNERGLAGTVDGRVAMKIRELKMSARRSAVGEGNGDGGGARLIINLGDDEPDKRIEIKRLAGEVNEDTEY